MDMTIPNGAIHDIPMIPLIDYFYQVTNGPTQSEQILLYLWGQCAKTSVIKF